MLHHLFEGHIQDDEGVRENTLPLHRQALHPCPRVPRQNETLLIFLVSIDLLLNHLVHDVILDNGVMFEV